MLVPHFHILILILKVLKNFRKMKHVCVCVCVCVSACCFATAASDLLPVGAKQQPKFTVMALVNFKHTRYGSCLLDVDAMTCNYKTISSLSIITSILSATRMESLFKLIIQPISFHVLRKRKLLISLVFWAGGLP